MAKGLSRLFVVRGNSRGPLAPMQLRQTVRLRDLGRGSLLEPEPQHPLLRICIEKPQAAQQLWDRNICGHLSAGRELLLLKQLS